MPAMSGRRHAVKMGGTAEKRFFPSRCAGRFFHAPNVSPTHPKGGTDPMYRKVSTDMNFVEREKEVLDFWKREGHHGKKFPSPRRRGAFHLLRRPAHGQRPPAHRPHRNARHQGPDSALSEHEGQGTSCARPAGIPTACPWSWRWKSCWVWTASRRSRPTASSPSSPSAKRAYGSISTSGRKCPTVWASGRI